MGHRSFEGGKNCSPLAFSRGAEIELLPMQSVYLALATNNKCQFVRADERFRVKFISSNKAPSCQGGLGDRSGASINTNALSPASYTSVGKLTSLVVTVDTRLNLHIFGSSKNSESRLRLVRSYHPFNSPALSEEFELPLSLLALQSCQIHRRHPLVFVVHRF